MPTRLCRVSFRAAPPNDHPKALQNLTNRIRRERDGTRNLVRDFLRIAAQESRLDYYPYETAINEIRKAATESYEARVAEGDSGAIFDEFDFGRLVENAVEQASLKTLEQISGRSEPQIRNPS